MSKSTNKPLLITAAVLALAVIGLVIWLVLLKGDVKSLQAEKELQKADFEAQVDSMMRVHNELKESYGELSQELAEKDSIIQADAVEIKKLLDSQWDYNRIKKKLADLQTVSQGYVRQLDSIINVNKELVAENERIKEEYNAEKQQNTVLVRQKQELTDKVNTAAILKPYNLEATGMRLKAGSTETTTDKAGRCDRIRVSFSLPENELAKSEYKTFYLRIAEPDKHVICKDESDTYSFPFGEGRLQYTEKQIVKYDNTKSNNVTMYYYKPDGKDLKTGLYMVDVYDETGNLVGQTSLSLK